MGAAQSIGGFRIFKVCPQSPAEAAGLEVFFDFIVEFDDIPLTNASANGLQWFNKKIQEFENRDVKMGVFSCRTGQFRDVVVSPKRWGGTGLLGATVRYDVYNKNVSEGIHVLEVEPGSPAEKAELKAGSDYLLFSATQQTVFKEVDDLVSLLNSRLKRSVLISVFSEDTQKIREVVLIPNYDWGGNGCLGCGIGTGYLHKFQLRDVGCQEMTNLYLNSNNTNDINDPADAVNTVPEMQVSCLEVCESSDITRPQVDKTSNLDWSFLQKYSQTSVLGTVPNNYQSSTTLPETDNPFRNFATGDAFSSVQSSDKSTGNAFVSQKEEIVTKKIPSAVQGLFDTSDIGKNIGYHPGYPGFVNDNRFSLKDGVPVHNFQTDDQIFQNDIFPAIVPNQTEKSLFEFPYRTFEGQPFTIDPTAKANNAAGSTGSFPGNEKTDTRFEFPRVSWLGIH